MSFYSANEAAALSNNRNDILLEINRIESAIMTAASNGSRETKIGPGSTPPVVEGFTNSSVHYLAWSDPSNNQLDTHKVARSQMNEVISEFSRKGYTVRRAQEGNTNTFNWI
ncbi:hypothetical protein CL653_03530, partial [bacterium]|nr:hypothetical protein [bacterium]